MYILIAIIYTVLIIVIGYLTIITVKGRWLLAECTHV